MEKHSILFITNSISTGGAERVTVNLANALCEQYNVTICSFRQKANDYPLKEKVNLIVAPELKKYSLKWFCIASYNKIRYKFEEILPALFLLPYTDVYHLHFVKHIKQQLKPKVTISMLVGPNAINASVSGGIRIMSERNDPRGKTNSRNSRNLKSFRCADRVVFQTEEVKSLYPINIQKKGVVIKNPIDVKPIEYKSDSKKITNIGRLRPQKNHELLINAFSIFHQNHTEYSLHIYGEGRDREQIERLIKDLGLENCIFMPGFVSNIHQKIADSKMFVLSSNYEGLSNALMEAMMMGIPSISTACNGSTELIQHGENGLLVPIGDEKKLVEAMEQLVKDDNLCRKISENAKKSSKSYKTEKILEEWQNLISQTEID